MADASLGAGSPALSQASASDAAGRGGRLPLVVWVYLVAVTLPVAFNVGPLFMTGLRLMLLIVIVPITFRLLMGRYDRLYVTDVLFLVHAAWVSVALFANDPSRAVQNGGIYAVEFYGGYALARATIRGPDQFGALVRAIALLVIATLPLTLYETFTGRPPLIEVIRSLPGILSVEIINIPKRMGLERVQAVFAHPIHYGLFASSAFSICYVGLATEWGAARRVIYAGLAGLCCFLALSSGAFLALLMQLFLIGWGMALNGVKGRWWILIGLSVLAYVVVDLLSDRTPVRVFFSYATFSAHNAYWRGIIFEWGMINVAQNPIFGIGLGDWVRPHFMRSGSMDNFWLVQAVRYGYPGFLTMAAGYLIVMWRMARLDFEGDARLWAYRRGWMFTFVGITFTLCTVHIWTSVFSYIFFLFGAGMWMLSATPGVGRSASAAPEPERPSRYARFSRDAPPSPRTAATGRAAPAPVRSKPFEVGGGRAAADPSPRDRSAGLRRARVEAPLRRGPGPEERRR